MLIKIAGASIDLCLIIVPKLISNNEEKIRNDIRNKNGNIIITSILFITLRDLNTVMINIV